MKYIRTEDARIVDTSICENVVKRTFNGEVAAIDGGQDSNKEIAFIWFVISRHYHR